MMELPSLWALKEFPLWRYRPLSSSMKHITIEKFYPKFRTIETCGASRRAGALCVIPVPAFSVKLRQFSSKNKLSNLNGLTCVKHFINGYMIDISEGCREGKSP